MKKIFIYMLPLLLLGACRKETPSLQYHAAFLSASMQQLPEAGSLDMYIGEKKVGVVDLTTGVTGLVISADEPVKVSFYIKGTHTFVMDTLLKAQPDANVQMRVAYNAAAGIHTMQTGGGNGIPSDSAYFLLYNDMPADLQPDDMQADAVLFRLDDAGQELETGIVWENFKRSAFHPMAVQVKMVENGVTLRYRVKVRNRATGDYIADALGQYFDLDLYGGTRAVFRVWGIDLSGGLYFFLTDNIAY